MFAKLSCEITGTPGSNTAPGTIAVQLTEYDQILVNIKERKAHLVQGSNTDSVVRKSVTLALCAC